jgi:hypothetical protein
MSINDDVACKTVLTHRNISELKTLVNSYLKLNVNGRMKTKIITTRIITDKKNKM